jgi:DNA-binding NarL/FixJ family response regulator
VPRAEVPPSNRRRRTQPRNRHVAFAIVLGCFDPLLERGLRAVLDDHGLDVILAGVDEASIGPAVEELRPDVAIFDETTSLSPTLLEQITLAHPSISVMVLAHHPSDLAIAPLSGARATYISKAAPVHELISSLTRRKEETTVEDGEEPLTARETEILELIRHQRFSHREIAQELDISINTARVHTASIRRKLRVGANRRLWS